MVISINTKIAALIRENKEVIEVLAKFNKNFARLRNPILRKILAPRVSIADAAKIGGANVGEMLAKLETLGFEVEQNKVREEKKENNMNLLKISTKQNTIVFDVRPILKNGLDPFNEINKKFQELKPNQILHIINTFEPTPLIKIFHKKGYSYQVVDEGEIIHTYFQKNTSTNMEEGTNPIHSATSKFDTLLKNKSFTIQEIDVTLMEPPEPMMNILSAIELLNNNEMILVHHKRIPQFLFPELEERNFKWAIKEFTDNDVKLLIYKS